MVTHDREMVDKMRKRVIALDERPPRPRRAPRRVRVMSSFRMVIAEALRSLRASMSTTVAASMTVLVAMLVLGTTIGLGTWLLSYSDHIKKQLQVTVYFNTEPPETPAQINAITRKFDPKVNPLVSKTTFVSKAQALKEQKKKFPRARRRRSRSTRIRTRFASSRRRPPISTTSGRSCVRSHRASTTSRTAATHRNGCSRSAESSRSSSSSA